jgi:multiple sugar transport system ATP-binding protein
MAAIRLEKVSRIYPGGVRAVDRLDLLVQEGELLALVGPSGCGKTTTLRMIAGLEEVSEGTIAIGDRVVNRLAPKDRNIAMVFQNYALYPHMSVYSNLAFALRLRQGSNLLERAVCRVAWPARYRRLAESERAIDRQVRTAADMLSIGHLLGRMPRQLSGGEKQRVAVGRAIVRQPAAFLLDEPLSNLDARLRVEMRRELKQLHARLAATMIYVTHDQTEALTLGDRIVVLDRGLVQQQGTPREVYDRPANRFVAGFVGSPPMNFLAGRLEASGDRVFFCRHRWRLEVDKTRYGVLQLSGREAALGVRPEDVSLDAAASGGPTSGDSAPGTAGWAGPLAARVSLVEPLGDAQLVHVELADDSSKGQGPLSLVCRAPPALGVQPGQAVTAQLNMGRAHLFDAGSGANLAPAAAR